MHSRATTEPSIRLIHEPVALRADLSQPSRMASDGKGGKGRGTFVENVERRKWDLADFERQREEREDRELRERVTNKSVVRAPLQRRTSDLALTRALGKYQGVERGRAGRGAKRACVRVCASRCGLTGGARLR
jgi:hypothetical protein